MIRLLLRRLLILPFLLILVNFSGFAYARFARYVQAGRNPYLAVSAASEPLLASYQAYLAKAPDGFGEMPNARGLSILIMIGQAAQASLGLLAVSFSIALVAGILFGFSATHNDPPGVARWLTPLSTIGMALPSFLTGGLLIAFTVYLALYSNFRQGFILPISGFGWDEHLIYPAIALALRPLVQIAQVTALLLSSELSLQYVTVARALGHNWLRIRTRHVLRNAMAPLILSVATTFRATVVELILVETIFSWTGLGRLLAQALIPPQMASTSRSALASPLYLNPPLVATLLTIFGLLFLCADLIASLAAHAADPRLASHPEALGDV